MSHNVSGFSGEASGFSKLSYDRCAYQKKIYQSVEPLGYMLYAGAYENCNKCRQDKFWRPFDKDIIDTESDLKNITRRNTKCPQYKYSPNQKKSYPTVLPSELCPIVHSNIPQVSGSGYKLRTEPYCGKF